ncbi:MAG: aminotransferase class I/II-fold pyridoxal phosphate-dependent enzyme [Spirochaetota bacterium]
MDLFKKCSQFKRHIDIEAAGYMPYFRPISENNGPTVKMEGHDVIMAGTNNYLGLSLDPRVKEAALQATRLFGTACSGSRYINGTLDLHNQLEAALADFTGKEAALIFSTGFQTNQGAIVPLISESDYLVSDAENHNSIIQGSLIVKGKHGSDRVKVYRHNDMEHLDEVLSNLPVDSGKFIVFDGVFSMSGELVPLPELVAVAKKHGARTMLDDAHGFGVLGDHGRGTANHFGLDDEVDILMGTFSKSFASQGGFLAGRREVIDYIKYGSPALQYSASMPPPQIASVLKSIEIMLQEPERMERLFHIQKSIREGLKALGFNVLDGQVPIVAVILSDDVLTFSFWRELMNEGVFVNAVIHPAVPQGMQLLRLSFMSTTEDQHIDTILGKFEVVGKRLGVLKQDTAAGY